MELTKQLLQEMIDKEISDLKQENLLDFFKSKKEKPSINFLDPAHHTREKLQATLDDEEQERLDLAVHAIREFLDQELSDTQRFEGLSKLRRIISSLLDPSTELDKVISRVLKEELVLMGALELENNFIKKNNIEECEAIEPIPTKPSIKIRLKR